MIPGEKRLNISPALQTGHLLTLKYSEARGREATRFFLRQTGHLRLANVWFVLRGIMDIKTFTELTGDTPEKAIGVDWENVDLAEWCDDCGHKPCDGGSYYCKMD
jgi:hypothetical protein